MADERQAEACAASVSATTVADRLVVEIALAEIAARHDAGQPVPVLDDHRLIEAMRLAVGIGLLLRDDGRGAALVHELRADEIAISNT